MLDLVLAILHHLFVFALFGGLLSIPPTLAFLRWRRESAPPTDAAVAKVWPYLWIEVTLFALLPAFAAATARGYGVF